MMHAVLERCVRFCPPCPLVTDHLLPGQMSFVAHACPPLGGRHAYRYFHFFHLLTWANPAFSTLFRKLAGDIPNEYQRSQDHRCLTPPSAPSTALEAHALYVCWESRLPDLRRPLVLRLLEAVAAHEAFSSPPTTRFSEAVENHLFWTWPQETPAAAAAAAAATTRDGKTVTGQEAGAMSIGSSIGGSISSSLNGGGNASSSHALPFLRETNLAVGGAHDLFNVTVASRGGCADEESGVAAASGAVPAAAAPGTGPSDTRGDDASAAAAAPGRRSREVEEEGPPRREGEPDGGRGARGSRGGVLADPDPELEALKRVYTGFYKNLVEAKGVPSGFRSCTTKSMDEGE